MLVAVRLADSVIDEIDVAFGVTLSRRWSRLDAGGESAAFRCGDVVVRVGPTWRTDADVEWTNEVAVAAADAVAEAVAPMVRPDGSTVVRIDERPVTLWPYVDGEATGCSAELAADLLARVHLALARMPWRPRPIPPGATVVDDHDLTTWLSIFDRDHPTKHALHGSFVPANVVVEGGRVTGLIAWDGAYVGPPERELAWAADAWGDADTFVDAYRTAGGPARRLGAHDLSQLARERAARNRPS